MGLRADRYKSGLVVIEGHNAVIPVTRENLNEFSQLVVYRSIEASAAKVQISSSAAADAAGQAGAITMEIIGCNAAYEIISEIVTLTGQTQFESANSYLRVFECNVLTTGSSGVNSGDIYVIVTGTGGTVTAGVPTTLTSGLVKIPIGYQRSFSGCYVVPKGHRAQVCKISLGAGTQGALFQIRATYLPTAASPLSMEFEQVIGVNTGLADLDVCDKHIQFPEGTHIQMDAYGLAASSNLYAKMDIKVL
jgi:hypothetical protein